MDEQNIRIQHHDKYYYSYFYIIIIYYMINYCNIYLTKNQYDIPFRLVNNASCDDSGGVKTISGK